MNAVSDFHANYFLMLVDDFKETTRYVELATPNLQTYSMQFLRQLLDVCSEIDDFAKLTCNILSPGCVSDRASINQWGPEIRKALVNAPRMTFAVGSGLRFTPWESWGQTPPENPAWWQAHNAVKHARTANFSKATQENVASALCGLAAIQIHGTGLMCAVWQQNYIRMVAL